MTGDWGGGVGMALMLAPRITNPGCQSSADAQHVWRGADMALLIQELLWSICKKREDEHSCQHKERQLKKKANDLRGKDKLSSERNGVKLVVKIPDSNYIMHLRLHKVVCFQRQG
jgi:hypothetical protein